MRLQTPRVGAVIVHTLDCVADIALSIWGPPIDPQLCFYLQEKQQHCMWMLEPYKLSRWIQTP